ncbi:hypothetical protein NDU88_004976 [Pleurodeles waltl]|uniref:Uncharacterized protein n=1 Tax=Pleurodeles waltl TaxID=8319 RepID=A0AAV7T9M6_PLEWA|nr:hypothetical protein NDU88_004976 [Pleurodeles waltl]
MEERASHRAAHLTSGDTYGQGYQDVQQLVPAKPSSSQGAGCVDEVLHYNDRDDPEEGEIVQQKGVHKGFRDQLKANGGRSFGVFQETTRKAVRSECRVGESRNTITAGNLPQGDERRVHAERGEESQFGRSEIGSKALGKDMGIQTDISDKSDGLIELSTQVVSGTEMGSENNNILMQKALRKPRTISNSHAKV